MDSFDSKEESGDSFLKRSLASLTKILKKKPFTKNDHYQQQLPFSFKDIDLSLNRKGEHNLGHTNMVYPKSANPFSSSNTSMSLLESKASHWQSRNLLALYITSCVVLVCWQYPILSVGLFYPISLVSGFYREIGHVIGCKATGCLVERFAVCPMDDLLGGGSSESSKPSSDSSSTSSLAWTQRYMGGSTCLMAPLGSLLPFLMAPLLIWSSYSSPSLALITSVLLIDSSLFVVIWVGGEWYARVGAVLALSLMIGLVFWKKGKYLNRMCRVFG